MGRVFTYCLIAALAFDSDSAVVTSGGAEFHICILGYTKLFSLIFDLKQVLSLLRPALLVFPWLVLDFSKKWLRQ